MTSAKTATVCLLAIVIFAAMCSLESSKYLRLSDGSIVTKLSIIGFAAFTIDESEPIWSVNFVPNPSLVKVSGSGIVLRYSSDYRFGGAVARYGEVMRAIGEIGVEDQTAIRDVTNKYVAKLMEENGSPQFVVSENGCVIAVFSSSKFSLYCAQN